MTREFLALLALAGCGPSKNASDTGRVADTATDTGGPLGVELVVLAEAVSSCDPYLPLVPDAWSSQTPSAVRAGLLGASLLRSHGDDAPVEIARQDTPLEVDLSAGAELARVDLGSVPDGDYTWLAVDLAWGAFDVDATAHDAITAAGTLRFDVALADYTDSDGGSRRQGDVALTFEVYGTSISSETSTTLSCPLSFTGGQPDSSGGSYRVRIPISPLTVDHAAPVAQTVDVAFPMDSAFTWEDLGESGYTDGIFDLSANPSTTETPTALPTCALLLGDRCAEDAEPTRIDPPGPMPDSATALCANDSETLATCPEEGEEAYGQDGNYAVNTPIYTATDGVVEDAVTGLVWQQAVDPTPVDWWAARDACASLDLGGWTDWTVPTRQELVTLLDLGSYNPSIDETSFPDTPADFFWSATPLPFSGLAWGVRFDQGHVYDHDPASAGYVRCVRRPAIHGSRWITADDTATDQLTGLSWERVFSDTSYTWVEALAYCEALDLAGQTDWRVPTDKELQTVVDDRLSASSADESVFPNTPADWFWSSSPLVTPAGYAWATSFTDGYATAAATEEHYRVRCVR